MRYITFSYFLKKVFVVFTQVCASNEYPQHMFSLRNKKMSTFGILILVGKVDFDDLLVFG